MNMADAPIYGSPMIVTKEPFTSLILSGEKEMELRPRPIQEGKVYFLADSTTHTVQAKIIFGKSVKLSQKDYEKTRKLHCVKQRIKRYKKTFGIYITSVQPLADKPSYQAKRGAIGFARFMPGAT